MKPVLLALAFLGASATWAHAQQIESACMRSDRDVKSPALCGCIQQAANLTLSARDQKLAATFYRDPSKAQEIRQSDRRSHEVFWQRYKKYLETAQAFCS